MDGLIFNIQRFSIHDGPGIRTTVFFKGCNLRCFWCHNPESRSVRPLIQFFPEKCILCGQCVEVCPTGAQQIVDEKRVFERSLCDHHALCVDVCFSKALVIAGESKTAVDVMREIKKDETYYKNSGGGVTFSGGEPMLQLEFLKELLVGCKEADYHTAVDTAGNVRWESFLEVLPYTDLFLFDMKTFDPEKHKQATGVPNAKIHQNLLKLGENGAKICIRIPVIPGVNDDVDEIKAIGQFLQQVKGLERIELLAFHHLGSGKYTSMGMDYPTKDLITPTAQHLDIMIAALKDLGLNAVRMA